MKYQVEYTVQALKALKKTDRYTRNLILAWIEKNLVNCTNPRQHGENLTSNHSGQWMYRIGEYRIIAEITEEKITILILIIGHRRNIYL